MVLGVSGPLPTAIARPIHDNLMCVVRQPIERTPGDPLRRVVGTRLVEALEQIIIPEEEDAFARPARRMSQGRGERGFPTPVGPRKITSSARQSTSSTDSSHRRPNDCMQSRLTCRLSVPSDVVRPAATLRRGTTGWIKRSIRESRIDRATPLAFLVWLEA